jgi:hypothetical protein
MLKLALALLLAANLLFFGFTRGWFDGLFGLHAHGDREPERIANQVRPAAIVLMPMASAPPGTSGACPRSAPIAAAEAAAAEAALRAAVPGKRGAKAAKRGRRSDGRDPRLPRRQRRRWPTARPRGQARQPGARLRPARAAR